MKRFSHQPTLFQGAHFDGPYPKEVIDEMMYDKNLSTVRRLRWMMRQQFLMSKLLGISSTASMHCPYCKSKVRMGDFFCCFGLERAWHMTGRSSNAPVLAKTIPYFAVEGSGSKFGGRPAGFVLYKAPAKRPIEEQL